MSWARIQRQGCSHATRAQRSARPLPRSPARGVAQHPFVSIHPIGLGHAAPQDFHRGAQRLPCRGHDIQAEGGRDVGASPEPEVIPAQMQIAVHRGKLAQTDHDLRADHGQARPGPEAEENPFPTPRVDVQPHGCKRLHLWPHL